MTSPFPTDLLERLASPATLSAAWERVRRRSPAAGVDRETPERFARDARARLEGLGAALLAGSYRPRPGRRIQAPDDPERRLVVATVTDRIVQAALALCLGPLYEQRFARSAWAYRPGRSVPRALAEEIGRAHV